MAALPKWILSYLDKEGFSKVEEAVRLAETATTGEIVPVVLRRSSSIGHVFTVLLLLLMLVYALIGMSHLLDELPVSVWLVHLGVTLSAAAASWLLAQKSFVQRWLTAKADRENQVLMRAQLEFYHTRVNHTEKATGILILVSLMEHQAVVLADRSIAEKLPPETWQEVVDLIINGIKKEEFATGLCAGVRRCGELLQTHFPMASGDRNELPNHLLIKEY